jgi:hypothetical protein
MTALRILSTSDLGAATVPLPTSHGDAGTCGGIVERLEAERERQPTIWLDCGDLVGVKFTFEGPAPSRA